MSDSVRILSWNLNGLPPTASFAKYHHKTLEAWFESLGADIVAFQETKVHGAKLTRELALVPGWDSFWAVCKAKKGYAGVVTYVRRALTPFAADSRALGEAELDDEGRLVVTDHGEFVLFNVYAPNSGNEGVRFEYKLKFLAAMEKKMDSVRASGQRVILVGDLNIPQAAQDVHPKLYPDTDKHFGFKPQEIQWLNKLEQRYVDAFRRLHPDRTEYTVWNQKKEARYRNEGLRIDYTLIDKALYDQGAVKAAAIVLTPMKMSDHVAVTCTLAVNCKGAARPCANAACNLPPFKATNKSLVSMFGKSHKKARKKRPRPATATATSTAAAVVATTKPITTPPPPSPVDETGSGGGAGGGAGVGLAAAAAAGAKRQRVPTVKRSLSATPPPSHTSKPPRGQASLHAFLSASSTN